MTELSRALGRRATLDDIPEAELDRLAGLGFDWVWFLSVWQTGPAGQKISREIPELRKELLEALPDLCEDDIIGSGFAITGYRVHEDLGGDSALARLRERLRKRGLRLMLDFVPNHTALDHPWVENHADYFVRGTEADLARAPRNFTWIRRPQGDLLFAHGRDPYFPGWSDTLQLNYGNPALQEAMTSELLKIAAQCDGVRCDMAMLVLPEVFERTWGIRTQPFWPQALRRVREVVKDFCFLAEVYWDLEWNLQQQGFDYTYDKRLYDRLRERRARPVREHFLAGLDYQNKLARFLENHDEPRAAAIFPQEIHKAAAVLTFFAPGLRFFHQGQMEGRLKRSPPYLGRAYEEQPNPHLKEFYERLLEILRKPIVRLGQWRLLDCLAAWEGNESFDAFIAFIWQDSAGARLIVAVNYADHPSQCLVRLPLGEPTPGSLHLPLRDLFGQASYERDGNELRSQGLFLDMGPWQYHVFEENPILQPRP